MTYLRLEGRAIMGEGKVRSDNKDDDPEVVCTRTCKRGMGKMSEEEALSELKREGYNPEGDRHFFFQTERRKSRERKAKK